jgi:hypothetical protein
MTKTDTSSDPKRARMHRIASRLNKLLRGENVETFPVSDEQHRKVIQQLDKERMEAEERKALRKLFGRRVRDTGPKP